MPQITPVDWRTLSKIFEKSGWKYSRAKGDHLVYTKEGFVRPVVIPMYKQIPEFIILNNLRTAKISRKEYFKILKSKK